MDKIFGTYSYSVLGLVFLLIVSPGVTMIEIMGSLALFSVAVLLQVALGIATLVCFARATENNMPPAPKWLYATLLLLLVPYTSALSTAIKALGGSYTLGGYWYPLGLLVMVLVIIFFLIRKERREAEVKKSTN